MFPSLLSLYHSLSSLSLSYHFSLPLSFLSHTLSLFLLFDAGTDLDMKKGAWQTRGRSCRQVTSPPSKQASVRKPFKKPRQVTVIKETQEADSEAPTQLGDVETPDNTDMGDVSEFYVQTETTVNQSTKNVEYVPSPASLKTVSETEDEQDNGADLRALGLAFRDEDTVIAIIPGVRTMSEREADETTMHGEPLWWSDDESDKIKAKLTAMGSTLPLTKPAHLSKEEWWETVLQSEKERLQHLEEARLVTVEKMCPDAGSSDDDVPIVRTLAVATSKARKKKKVKSLWSYEVVAEATGVQSRYWDAAAPKERATKQQAKQKLDELKISEKHPVGASYK